MQQYMYGGAYRTDNSFNFDFRVVDLTWGVLNSADPCSNLDNLRYHVDVFAAYEFRSQEDRAGVLSEQHE